jgi:hypothetical protein
MATKQRRFQNRRERAAAAAAADIVISMLTWSWLRARFTNIFTDGLA